MNAEAKFPRVFKTIAFGECEVPEAWVVTVDERGYTCRVFTLNEAANERWNRLMNLGEGERLDYAKELTRAGPEQTFTDIEAARRSFSGEWDVRLTVRPVSSSSRSTRFATTKIGWRVKASCASSLASATLCRKPAAPLT